MTLAPAELMQLAPRKVRDRGEALIGAVRARTREGDTLQARVQGSESVPYRVSVDLAAGRWSCSCPDDLNELCKHVYALLLVAEMAPESFVKVTAGRRLPDVKKWSDGDVERLLESVLEHHRAVATDWARVVAERPGVLQGVRSGQEGAL